MGSRLFVKNLPFDATEKQLRALLETDERRVQSIKIVLDKETNQSRGFAFVEMGSEEDAKATIAACNGKELGGRALVVDEAQDKAGSGGRFSGAGGGGGFRTGREQPHGGSGFGSRGPGQNMPRGSTRGGGRGGSRGS